MGSVVRLSGRGGAESTGICVSRHRPRGDIVSSGRGQKQEGEGNAGHISLLGSACQRNTQTHGLGIEAALYLDKHLNTLPVPAG